MPASILVEFYSTCPDCRGSEQLVRAVCAAPPWDGVVELVIYRLDQDPSAGTRYPGTIRGPAVCVAGQPVVPIGIYGLRRALTEASRRMLRSEP